MQAARALGICFGDAAGAASPFLARIGNVATSDDVELDAEFVLDSHESAPRAGRISRPNPC